MDLKKFRIVAMRKRHTLSTFLGHLDNIVPPDIDDIAERADKAMWEQTDCTTCANCCKKMTPTFSPQDVKRIAAHLEMSPKEFRDKWLYKDEESGDWMNKTQPCQFLANNMCTIYEVRPVDCAEFPHHTKKPFDMYNDMYKVNMMHCPATLTLVDKMRKEVERRYEWPQE